MIEQVKQTVNEWFRHRQKRNHFSYCVTPCGSRWTGLENHTTFLCRVYEADAATWFHFECGVGIVPTALKTEVLEWLLVDQKKILSPVRFVFNENDDRLMICVQSRGPCTALTKHGVGETLDALSIVADATFAMLERVFNMVPIAKKSEPLLTLVREPCRKAPTDG